MNQQIWQWTLTKEAIAPCFVRDVLAMRQHINEDQDFFWLGHTPCRTVLLVGMVVGIQVYDKRAIYTIDDGTAVIDCVLRHPRSAFKEHKPLLPQRSNGGPDAEAHPQRPLPKKTRLDKTEVESMEPPPPITEPGYPVRVVGRVMRHYKSKRIQVDTIDPCPSSLDEIAHLGCVIELHKTKYSLTVPFVPPAGPTPLAPSPDTSEQLAGTDADASVFSNASCPRPNTPPYSLPPPIMPKSLQSRNRFPPVPGHPHSAYHGHTGIPSTTASSVASSTPSSPCRPSSPVKAYEASHKPKIRHPSHLHTRDLTSNTFRLYVKHYMDNALPLFPASFPSSRDVCEGVTTPTKYARDDDDETTPRPRLNSNNKGGDDEDTPMMGFTLSHLRRVPELALLAARVVRAEARRRDKTEQGKEQCNSRSCLSSSSVSARPSGSKSRNKSTVTPQSKVVADPPRKKMKRLFSWAVVKLYEEGSIVLWDGEVRPLPVPPPPMPDGPGERSRDGLWKGTRGTFGDPSVSYVHSYSMCTAGPASVLYTSSASASLYSHYHPPRQPAERLLEGKRRKGDVGAGAEADEVDLDADPGSVSDPGVDEEAYVPLTPRLLAGYVRQAMGALRHGRGRGGTGAGADRVRVSTPEDILAYLQRSDGRWARVGVWTVEEALAVLKAGS